ncbi:MAG: hypothetical protein IE922_09305 [Sphingomonadales bacterium]|nr:hypothetical protein [Sphingomonadales bacterium]
MQATRQEWARKSRGPAAFTLVLTLVLGLGLSPARAQEEDDGPPPDDLAVAQSVAAQKGRGAVTNLPLPRFVSLKGSEGNARRGPSLSHRIDWVFTHAGMPLKITAEFGHWRRVEDRDGAGGWVHYSLLSGVRSVIIEEDMAELRARPDPRAQVVARAESGALAKLEDCTRDWCEVTAEDADGWLPKTALWGVFPEEIRD